MADVDITEVGLLRKKLWDVLANHGGADLMAPADQLLTLKRVTTLMALGQLLGDFVVLIDAGDEARMARSFALVDRIANTQVELRLADGVLPVPETLQ